MFKFGNQLVCKPTGERVLFLKYLNHGLQCLVSWTQGVNIGECGCINAEDLEPCSSEVKKETLLQVVEVRLTSSAANRIPYNMYNQIASWLSSWTPINNIEGIICSDIDEGLTTISKNFPKMFPASMSRLCAKPSDFEVKIGVQEIKNNRVWLMTKGSIHGSWYPLKDQE